MTRALLVVDVQNDFILSSGALPVPEGDIIIPVINKIIGKFPAHIFTKDWHPTDHCSFKENGGDWPKHCVEMSIGAELHPELDLKKCQSKDTFYWVKGHFSTQEEYSPFTRQHDGESSFKQFLENNGIIALYICGLASEFCVKATVLDAIKYGFNVIVVIDGIKGLSEKGTDEALEEMLLAGASFIASDDVR